MENTILPANWGRLLNVFINAMDLSDEEEEALIHLALLWERNVTRAQKHVFSTMSAPTIISRYPAIDPCWDTYFTLRNSQSTGDLSPEATNQALEMIKG